MRKKFTREKSTGMKMLMRVLTLSLLNLCLTRHSAVGQCQITGVKLVSQTPDSTVFTWDQLPDATQPYQYYYSMSPILNSDPDSLQSTNSSTDNTATLIGLCGGATYYLFVAGQCDDSPTQTWTMFTFTKQCFPIIPSSVTVKGRGVYCSGVFVNIGMNGYEKSQTYTWNQSGKPVKTIVGNDPGAGSGGSLSYGFTIVNSDSDGIYTITTYHDCSICTGSAQFAQFPVYFAAVSGVKTTQVTSSSVSFQWNPLVANEPYQYAVDTDPNGPNGTIYNTTSTSGTVPGLSPGTDYILFVRAACDDNSSTINGYGDWTMISFKTLPANHTCQVQMGSLTGGGNYCAGNTVKLTIPVTQGNQTYSFLRNGQPVDTLMGNGGPLSYSFLMQSPGQAGTYSVTTNDTCNCCTALPFGNAVVSYDSVTGLATDAITTSSVGFHWNSLGTGVNYQYGVSLSKTQAPVNPVSTTGVTGTIPGLQAGTLYYIYVRAQCDNGVGATGYGNWDTLSFTTTAVVIHTCNVQPGTLTGGGVYCPNSSGNLTIPQTLKSQNYSILLNGQAVYTAQGNGGALSYPLTVQSSAQAGTYTVTTNDTCQCCTAVSFGSAVVSLDAITGLATDAITTNSVSFHWNSVATGAVYQYGVSLSATQAPSYTSTTGTTATVTALSPGTVYYIYVSGQCDNGVGGTGFSDPVILSFTTTASGTTHTCNVQPGTLTGGGVYCPNSSGNLTIPQTLKSQNYSFLLNGQAVYTAQGTGGALSYPLTVQSSAQAGTYTVTTNDTCQCCTAVSFGNAVVSLDAITGLATDAITTNSVSFHWNSVATGAVYQYGVSLSATQAPSYTSTTGTTAMVTALSPGTVYYIYVSGQCDNGVGGTGFSDPVILSFTTETAGTTHTCNVQGGTLTGGGVYCPGNLVNLSIPVTQANQGYAIQQNGQTVFNGKGAADGSALSYSFRLEMASQAGVYTVTTGDTCSCCTPVSFGSVTVTYDSVSGLATDAITANSVAFHWNSMVAGATYQYGISTTGTRAPARLVTTTGTTGSQNGLAGSTTYYIYVSAQCDNGGGATGFGNWDILRIKTPADTTTTTPPVPPVDCDTVPTPVAKLFGSQLGSSALTGNQWLLNGAVIPGATSYGYTPTESGSYTVQVTANGCIKLSAPVTVNISDLASPNVRIFPNPITTQITINNLGSNAVTVQLFDLMGRQITGLSGVRGVYIMSSAQLERGMYTIQVTDEKTHHKMTRLLVKM